jgi:quercetin dioxygenase-like cupin family protein
MRIFLLAFSVFAAAMTVSGCGNKSVAAAQPERALAISAGNPELIWGPCPQIFPSGCEIAVLHGDPAAPNADVYLRVPAGFEIPSHSHTSVERMILVTGELTVVYQGQAAVTLSTGDYAFGPAKAPHKADCVSDTPCTLFIAFESAVDAEPFDGDL